MSAAFYAQYELNDGKPVASSVPASEHSVMTSWQSEEEAVQNMITQFDGENKVKPREHAYAIKMNLNYQLTNIVNSSFFLQVFSVVMDSYDYSKALKEILPKVAEEHKKNKGIFVIRPDSGDPVECILLAMEEGEKTFGATKNEKGFKVLNGIAALQGDGIK